MTQGQKTCRTVAWAFSIVDVALFAILAIVLFVQYGQLNSMLAPLDQYDLIPLDMMLPMAIVLIILAGVQVVFLILNGKARKDEHSHVALGVLQIIFGNIISGILMLCSGGKPQKASK